MTDDELIQEFTRKRRFQNKISIQAKLITWSGPHTPKSHWHTEIVLPVDANDESIQMERKKLLSNLKYFAICEECHERNPIGWMLGIEGICHSCAEKSGVVF